jgi:hypothetical protein
MEKRTFTAIFLLIVFCLSINAGDRDKNFSLISKNRRQDLRFKEAEYILKKRKALFNLDVNVQLGLGIANTSVELNQVSSSTQSLQNTSSKIGPSIGAIVNVDFIGFGFTTGFLYSSKGFKQNVDAVGGEQGEAVTNSWNYLNIPLLFFIGFDINNKVLVDLNFGPYFGLLLSQDETTYLTVKNFDFGLTGDLSGAYMFNRYMGALLGLKYEYGGLNNLGSNEFVKKTTSSTFFIYSGLKFVL